MQIKGIAATHRFRPAPGGNDGENRQGRKN
jgi:hypothetical protein